MENSFDNKTSAIFNSQCLHMNTKGNSSKRNNGNKNNLTLIKTKSGIKLGSKKADPPKHNSSCIEEEKGAVSILNCKEDLKGNRMEEEESTQIPEENSIFEASTCPNSNDKGQIESIPSKNPKDFFTCSPFELTPPLETCLQVDPKTLEILKATEIAYHPNAAYIELLQREMNQQMRAVLVDWMMQVSNWFCLKRETFYGAVNFVDRYLSVKQDVPKLILQLLGATALYIASKIEEIYPPELEYFYKACNKEFTKNEIVEMEIDLLCYLSFRMNPPSASILFNFYSSQWDALVSLNLLQVGFPLDYIKFREPSNESYGLFQQATQVIDLLTLDYDSISYETSQLVLATIYLTLTMRLEIYSKEKISNEVSKNFKTPPDNENAQFMNVFSKFYSAVSFSNDPYLFETCVSFVASFFKMTFVFQVPRAVELGQDEDKLQVAFI